MIVETPVILGAGYYDVGQIGAFTTINIGRYSNEESSKVYIDAKQIGRFCMFAKNIKIGLANHPTDFISPHMMFRYDSKAIFFDNYMKKGKLPEWEKTISATNKARSRKELPVIGNDVWIGADAIVLNGVTLGDGAIIAAGSVVTHDVSPYEIVGGNPAHHIKYRFEEKIVKQLCSIKWWEYGPDILYGLNQGDIDQCLHSLQQRIDEGFPRYVSKVIEYNLTKAVK